MAPSAAAGAVAAGGGGGGTAPVADHIRVQRLIRAYRVRGHNMANLDPLGVFDADLCPDPPAELDLAEYGFTDADLDRTFQITEKGGRAYATLFDDDRPHTLREIVDKCNARYCGTIGYQFKYMDDAEPVSYTHLTLPTKA